MTSGGSTGEMLKEALQEESMPFENITQVGHRKISLQLMTTRILSFVCFPAPPVTTEKIKLFQLFKKLEFIWFKRWIE
jgi:hypothetical protein